MKPSSKQHEEELKKAERIAYLIAGHLRNTLSLEESDELDDWISESDENLELFEKLTDEDHVEASIQQYLEIERRKAGAYEKVQEGISTEVKRKGRSIWIYLTAACALIVIAVSIFLLSISDNSKPGEKPIVKNSGTDIKPGTDKAVLVLSNGRTIILDQESDGVLDNNDGVTITKQDGGELSYTSSDANPLTFHTLSTPRGGKYKILLPDGTMVWLNAESSLRYPTSFSKSTSREVELRGEGYFEVAKDAAHPFLVKLDDKGMVEVLGTHFNVNGYEGVKVVLVEGRVRVGGNEKWKMENGKWAELRPGEMGEIKEDGEVSVSKGDVEEAVAWTKDKFLFRNADIHSIGEQIKRWYDVEVKYEGNITQHFNTEMSRDLPLSKLLDGLQGTMQVHFELRGRSLTIKP